MAVVGAGMVVVLAWWWLRLALWLSRTMCIIFIVGCLNMIIKKKKKKKKNGNSRAHSRPHVFSRFSPPYNFWIAPKLMM
jgi:hypothetical protein